MVAQKIEMSPSSVGRACLNCGWTVEQTFCPNCGQHIASHNKGIWQFVQEFLEEFIRFDSKLLRTLHPLVTKPGFLTAEWASGKRVRYISPLKIYITISALFFLALSVSPNASIFSGQVAPQVERQSRLDKLFDRAIPGMSHVEPALLRQHISMHLPTASLLLVPLSALVFWLLYLRQKRYYVEHLVFCLHYNCFCFLSYGFASLLPGEVPRIVAFLWAVGYLLVAIKANYGENWLKSFLKFSVFGVAYVALVISTILGTVAVSASMASSMNPKAGGSETMHMHSH